MPNLARRVIGVVLMLTLFAFTARADAGMVSGIYTNRAGTPLSDRQLHFQNRIGGDMYLTRTGSDGSFSADLPPGVYDLRAERGVIAKSNVVVGETPENIGTVREAHLFSDWIRGPFERQGLAPELLDSPAPATAHVAGPGPEQNSATYWAPANPAPAAPQSTAAAH